MDTDSEVSKMSLASFESSMASGGRRASEGPGALREKTISRI